MLQPAPPQGKNQKSIPIQNWDHFFELSKTFDKENKTYTSLVWMTLPEIVLKFFPTIYSDNALKNVWNWRVRTAFAESNTFTSEQEDNYYGRFTDFNNIVTFKNNFKQHGFKVLHPLHLHIMHKGNIMHPGGKRIELLKNIYKDPVPLVITDYTRQHRLGIAKYNFNPTLLHFTIEDYVKDTHNQYKMYKEVHAKDEILFNDYSYCAAYELNELRTFKCKKGKVTCNGEVLMYKDHKDWRLNIDD